MTLKILIVDDEEENLSTIKRYLEFAFDFDILTAHSFETAIDVVKRETPAIVLSDISMPGRSGIDLLEEWKPHNPSTQFIIMTGQSSLDKALDCLEKGAIDYLMKPLDMSKLETLVKESSERYQRWYEVIKHNLKEKRKGR